MARCRVGFPGSRSNFPAVRCGHGSIPVMGSSMFPVLKGWQTNAKGKGGLDRIRYTGKPVHLPKSLEVKKDRIEVGFYEALDPQLANDLSKYKFGAWNLKWSSNYGSPEIPVNDLKLDKVELLEDGKTVASACAQPAPRPHGAD